MFTSKEYLKFRFSIVIPVLNEQNNISKLIILIKKYLKNFKYEIIFIDDNSTDNTAKIIKKYLSKNIKYFLRKKNKDLSLSCFLGIKKSKHENIIIMDADLQHHPRYIPIMVNLFFKKKTDFVVGVRNFKNDVALGSVRRFSSIFLSYLINYFLSYKISDPMSGFFMFKKKIFHTHKNTLYGKGWKILADLIYNKENFSVCEFQFKFLKRLENKSKMNFEVLKNIIKLLLFKYKTLKI
jgi:dolichol-phosphate mannosyltransferase